MHECYGCSVSRLKKWHAWCIQPACQKSRKTLISAEKWQNFGDVKSTNRKHMIQHVQTHRKNPMKFNSFSLKSDPLRDYWKKHQNDKGSEFLNFWYLDVVVALLCTRCLCLRQNMGFKMHCKNRTKQIFLNFVKMYMTNLHVTLSMTQLACYRIPASALNISVWMHSCL